MVAVSETEEKGYVAQRCNLGQLVFPSIRTAFHPRLPTSSLLFPGSLSVYIGYNEQLFPETRSGARRDRPRRRKWEKSSRDSAGRCIIDRGLKAGYMRDLKSRVARLIRSAEVRLGISLNNAFRVVDWLIVLVFYRSLSLLFVDSFSLAGKCMCTSEIVCRSNGAFVGSL